MFHGRTQNNMQKPRVYFRTETTTNSPSILSPRGRRNANLNVSDRSTRMSATQDGVHEQKVSSEHNGQDRTDKVETKTAKKVYTMASMLRLKDLPMTQKEPGYLKQFKELRIRRPVVVDVPSYSRKTLPNQTDFDSKPSHDGSLRFRDNYRGRSNGGGPDNNAPAERFDANVVRPHVHGYHLGRGQHKTNGYNTAKAHGTTAHPSEYGHGNSRHRSQDQRGFNNNARYHPDGAKTGSRNSGCYSNSNNVGGFKTNNISEHESTINPNLRKRTVIHYTLAKNSVVELNTSKNAWVPPCRDSQNSARTSEADVEEIQKKVRSILNKITPETMVVLTKSIIDMDITTHDCLGKIIELLFQKAIDEPNFTPQYAYICSQMKDIEITSEDDKTKISFKKLIILKCQKTFELISAQEKNAMESLAVIASCKDQALKKDLQFKFDENERVQKKRSVGNCRFMCELFKVELLNSKVLEMCVKHLLKSPKEEPLECLCNILKHIGKYLNPENTFEKLQEYSSPSYKTKISSRIRFMILNTIELKNNNWVPRNAVIKPKMLNEIEKEFTRASSTNKTITECIPPTDKSLKICLTSNTEKCKSNDQNKSFTNSEESGIETRSLVKNIDVELNTCKNAWVPRFRSSQKSTVSNSNEINVENKLHEQMTNSNSEKKETVHCSLVEDNEIKLNTSTNAWVPRFRNSHKSIETNEIEVKKTEKTVQELPIQGINTMSDNQQLKNNSQNKSGIKRNTTHFSQKKFINKPTTPECKLQKQDTCVKTTTSMPQDSCESFYSMIYSVTQENIVSSTHKLINRILSIEHIEETINVLMKRAISEPNSVALMVEICSSLKVIVLSIDKGSTHVSFKKQLAARCQKLLQKGNLEHKSQSQDPIMSKETYTMIGELFNKKILPLNVMVEFIKDIPNRLTNTSIENICYFLQIIGAEIERPYSLKLTMKHLETYVINDVKRLISPEHREKVINLIELRNNKWIPVNISGPSLKSKKADTNVGHLQDDKLLSMKVPNGRHKHDKNNWRSKEKLK